MSSWRTAENSRMTPENLLYRIQETSRPGPENSDPDEVLLDRVSKAHLPWRKTRNFRPGLVHEAESVTGER